MKLELRSHEVRIEVRSLLKLEVRSDDVRSVEVRSVEVRSNVSSGKLEVRSWK